VNRRTHAARPVVRVPMDMKEPALLMEPWWLTVRGKDYVVPAGFSSDGASIPKALQAVCGSSMQTPRLYAAIWHDAAYSGLYAGLTRRDADLGYRELLLLFWRVEYVEDGIGRRAQGIYARIHNGMARVLNCISWAVATVECAALRVGGRSHWTTISGTSAGTQKGN